MEKKLYSLYALLWIDRDSEKEIADVLINKCGGIFSFISRISKNLFQGIGIGQILLLEVTYFLSSSTVII
jgi:hypothetical protein